MEFSKQAWEDRIKGGGMGDQAEAVFERVYPNGFVRTGLNRPPLQVWKLPLRERYRPDYMTSNSYIEVKGFGRGQSLSLKVENYSVLQFWHQVFPVELFIYDSYYDRWVLVGLRKVDEWINQGRANLKYFPEQKAYFSISADTIFAVDNA